MPTRQNKTDEQTNGESEEVHVLQRCGVQMTTRMMRRMRMVMQNGKQSSNGERERVVQSREGGRAGGHPQPPTLLAKLNEEGRHRKRPAVAGDEEWTTIKRRATDVYAEREYGSRVINDNNNAKQ
jgi:hypothetical protein